VTSIENRKRNVNREQERGRLQKDDERVAVISGLDNRMSEGQGEEEERGGGSGESDHHSEAG